MNLHAIVAVDERGAIGANNKLLFEDPIDKMFFYNMTVGRTVIMGNNTFKSLGKKPLPDRTNIVLTRRMPDGVTGNVKLTNGRVLTQEILDDHPGSILRDAFVIGGAEIYQLLLPYTKYIHRTVFMTKAMNPDCFFPELDMLSDWKITKMARVDSFEGYRLRFETLVRK